MTTKARQDALARRAPPDQLKGPPKGKDKDKGKGKWRRRLSHHHHRGRDPATCAILQVRFLLHLRPPANRLWAWRRSLSSLPPDVRSHQTRVWPDPCIPPPTLRLLRPLSPLVHSGPARTETKPEPVVFPLQGSRPEPAAAPSGTRHPTSHPAPAPAGSSAKGSPGQPFPPLPPTQPVQPRVPRFSVAVLSFFDGIATTLLAVKSWRVQPVIVWAWELDPSAIQVASSQHAELVHQDDAFAKSPADVLTALSSVLRKDTVILLFVPRRAMTFRLSVRHPPAQVVSKAPSSRSLQLGSRPS